MKTEWIVRSLPTEHSIDIKIYLNIIFRKSTWLEKTIIANTRSELVDVYHLWHRHANDFLEVNPQRSSSPSLHMDTSNNVAAEPSEAMDGKEI